MKYTLKIQVPGESIDIVKQYLYMNQKEALDCIVKQYLKNTGLADAVGMVLDINSRCIRLRNEYDDDNDRVVNLINPVLLTERN